MVKQNPEEKAREYIDRLLEDAGWTIQDYPEFNLGTSLGVAVREFPLESGFTDYLLFLEISPDECHRSIYGLWRQVIEYFDAFTIGLTATPSKQTLGFFNKNLVMDHSHERAVADGVKVGYEVYRIKTNITEKGSKVEAGGELVKSACVPFDSSKLRNLLSETKNRNEQDIDTTSIDTVIFSGFDELAKIKARTLVDTFKKFIEENKDEITALQIIYSSSLSIEWMILNYRRSMKEEEQ